MIWRTFRTFITSYAIVAMALVPLFTLKYINMSNHIKILEETVDFYKVSLNEYKTKYEYYFNGALNRDLLNICSSGENIQLQLDVLFKDECIEEEHQTQEKG